MEEKVRRREKMAAVGEMAAGLAHEIRNPLSSLSGSIQLLRSELNLAEEHGILMDIVVRETERLNHLLNDFLLFARPKQMHKEIFALHALLEETLSLFTLDQRYQAIQIQCEMSPEIKVNADPQLLHQIVWNLLLNAAQSMEKTGGCIELRAEETEIGTVISIQDTGEGIPRTIKEKIFEPFFSTRSRGSGLGLSVVQRIVADHGGQVEIEDVEPHGTCFRIFLPSYDDSGLDEGVKENRPVSPENSQEDTDGSSSTADMMWATRVPTARELLPVSATSVPLPEIATSKTSKSTG
jgi:two-component system sensor histidine kinase PilS (NtrC family)